MYTGSWVSAPNPGAASPQEFSWGLRYQSPVGAPPETPLEVRPKPRSGGSLGAAAPCGVWGLWCRSEGQRGREMWRADRVRGLLEARMNTRAHAIDRSLVRYISAFPQLRLGMDRSVVAFVRCSDVCFAATPEGVDVWLVCPLV